MGMREMERGLMPDPQNNTSYPIINHRIHFDIVLMAVRAYEAKGRLTTDPVRASGILCEECGEVMAEALKKTNPNGPASHRNAAGTAGAMYHELAQVAATAVIMMGALTEEMASDT